jgi:hypothetical protein
MPTFAGVPVELFFNGGFTHMTVIEILTQRQAQSDWNVLAPIMVRSPHDALVYAIWRVGGLRWTRLNGKR